MRAARSWRAEAARAAARATSRQIATMAMATAQRPPRVDVAWSQRLGGRGVAVTVPPAGSSTPIGPLCGAEARKPSPEVTITVALMSAGPSTDTDAAASVPVRSLADDIRGRTDEQLTALVLSRPDLARPAPPT